MFNIVKKFRRKFLVTRFNYHRKRTCRFYAESMKSMRRDDDDGYDHWWLKAKIESDRQYKTWKKILNLH